MKSIMNLIEESRDAYVKMMDAWVVDDTVTYSEQKERHSILQTQIEEHYGR